MKKFLHLDLFSGIGGYALAVDRVWPNSTHIFCDNDLFCQEVLKKHWPNSKIYGDIRSITTNTTSDRFAGGGSATTVQEGHQEESEQSGQLAWGFERPYILTGGFPCQPFSQAGRRRGTSDARWLWPEMFRVVQLTKPQFVLAENVRGLVNWQGGVAFRQVLSDLESEGYLTQTFIIPAVAVNAPHRRDRIWFVAHAKSAGTRGDGGATTDQGGRASEGRGESLRQTYGSTGTSGSTAANTDAQNTISQRSGRRMESNGQVLERQSTKIKDERSSWEEDWIEVATRLCTLDDGLPNGLLRPKGWRNAALKAVGNSIVPQVAEEIMKAIKQAHD